MTVIIEPVLGSWSPAVVILGENDPRIVHRAELVIEFDDEAAEYRYALHWWMSDGATNLGGWVSDGGGHFARSVHRLISMDANGMRGQHDCLTGGDLGVFALEGR